MTFKHLIVLILSLSMISCGGGGSDTAKETSPPPFVTLSIDSTSIDESSTVVITHSAKDYQDTTITSKLSCDIGTLEVNNYTAPNVATETTATCTATATDNGNRSSTETLVLTINAVTPVLELANGETEVVAAQIVTLNVENALITNDNLTATLNGEPIQLARLNDTQLAFMFPLIAPDAHSLTTVIENKTVTLNFSSQAVSVPWVDSSVYVNNYLQELKDSLNQLESLGGESLDINTVNELREFLSPDGAYLSSLSEEDKELLARMIYQNIVPLMQATQAKISVQRSVSPQCVLLGGTSGTIALSTIATIALALTPVGPAVVLNPPVLAGLAIINMANFAVIMPAAKKACTRPFRTVFNSISADLEGLDRIQKSKKNQNIKQPIKTSMNQESDILDFFSNKPKKILAKRQYEIITGNEGDFKNIIDSFNSVGVHVRKLISYLEANPLPVIGKVTVPIFLENFFSENISFEDIRYEDISPSNLNISAIIDTGVTGGDITIINEDNSFDLTFNIEDLDVPHIAFQFTITDSGQETPLSTVIDAEVTLNPPIAYSETFSTVVGEEMVARLQADFETGFKIKEQPKFGTLDTSLDSFSMPEGGLFGYTPDKNITEEKTDTFTFVATNGSTKNDGESNEATITVLVKPAEVLIFQLTITETISGTNCNEGNEAPQVYQEVWILYLNNCKNGACLIKINGIDGLYTGYSLNPISNTIAVTDDEWSMAVGINLETGEVNGTSRDIFSQDDGSKLVCTWNLHGSP